MQAPKLLAYSGWHTGKHKKVAAALNKDFKWKIWLVRSALHAAQKEIQQSRLHKVCPRQENVNSNLWRLGKTASLMKMLLNPAWRPWGLQHSSWVLGGASALLLQLGLWHPHHHHSRCSQGRKPPCSLTKLQATFYFPKDKNYWPTRYYITYSLHYFHIAHMITDISLEQHLVFYQHYIYTDRIETLPCKEHNILEVKSFMYLFQTGAKQLLPFMQVYFKRFLWAENSKVQLFLKPFKKNSRAWHTLLFTKW